MSDRVQQIRADFPMLKQKSHGHPLVYFNAAATALKPEPVLQAMDQYYREFGVNVFRGVDTVAYRATEAYENSRKTVAAFIGAKRLDEIIFTRGTTEALNLVCNSYAENFVKEGQDIIVSAAEHHANYLPWQQLAKRKKLNLILAELDENGVLTEANLEAALTTNTAIVATAHISNVMGAKNDIPALAALAHKYGAKIVVDGAQGIVHERPQLSLWDVDFYAFSGHKLYGPTGVGVLYGKIELLKQMPPVNWGGEMIDKVGVYDTTVADPPNRFEGGTPMIAEVIGLAAALNYVDSIGYEYMQERIELLVERMCSGLKDIEGIKIYNEANSKHSAIVSFNVEGVHAHDAASVFDQAGISLRAGQHCNQPTMDWLCEIAILRASLSFFNTEEEVEYFIEVAKKAGDFLGVFI